MVGADPKEVLPNIGADSEEYTVAAVNKLVLGAVPKPVLPNTGADSEDFAVVEIVAAVELKEKVLGVVLEIGG